MARAKQFTRLATLKGSYTEDAIRERIAEYVKSKDLAVPTKTIHTTIITATTKPSLLIDIQAKIREGKGEGYAKWAAAQNLKQMARTLIYLQERGLDDFNKLSKTAEEAKCRFNELSRHINNLDQKLTSNANLQKQIVTYSKTRAIYTEYRKAGYSKKFKAAHESDILLHQTAKKTFDELGYSKGKKLPSVASLRAEYAPVLEEKKRAYKEYRQAKAEMQELMTAKANVQRFLNINEQQMENTTREVTY